MQKPRSVNLSTTFIPGSWTQSIAVPVAFDTNSAKVSSAIEKKSLAGTERREQSNKSQLFNFSLL
jgi:hypothetical protein